MTTLTDQEIIQSFYDALKGVLEDGSNWPSGNGFTVYAYDNMRDYRIEPPRPFLFLGSRGLGDEPTWRPCIIINSSTKRVNAEMGTRSTLLTVVVNIIARHGGEESGLSQVLKDALDAVTFTSTDGLTEVVSDTEDGWSEDPYEVPAAIAMEGSLRQWLALSATYLLM